MMGYGLIMSFLFLKYFDINRKNSSDKNFIYQWNLDNTELSLVNKKSQEINAVYMDKNFDLNYEKTLGYCQGKIVSESIDKMKMEFMKKYCFLTSKVIVLVKA